ncbi:type II secretion system protein E [Pyrolobus fumarii 1A]|uniref:Type II secretion system protein E n=1 Tax=Pyrolobus fumarii (strain DSM 11204 / 1A) TaxID=694429 RepID=G0EFQ0_PYRF1|nr:type II/IV secretion system ATPase subunit [Pyrolobus fumarii]AEM38221.1 type II secretion system protein E [Pyrolobus fumarii 1A]
MKGLDLNGLRKALLDAFVPGRRRRRIATGYRLVSAQADAVVLPGRARVLRSYRAGVDNLATVYLVEFENEVMYLVHEPPVSESVRRYYPLVMDHIAFTARPPSDGINHEEYLKAVVIEAVEELGLADVMSGDDLRALQYYVTRDVAGWGPIDVLVRDPNVEEVAGLPGRPVQVVHRDVGWVTWIETNIVMPREAEMARYVQRLAQKAGQYISTANPLLEARTPERHRIALNLGDIHGVGPGFVLRKFPEVPYSVPKLVELGTLSPLLAAYLMLLLELYGNVFFVGEMASGKTTMLNATLSMAPPDWRIVTVEDVPELRLPHPGWDPLYTRRSFFAGTARDVTLFDLVKFALRRRAQVIVVGEVRGEEASVLIQALATGHGGGGTFHAGSLHEMVTRLVSPPLSVGPSFIRVLNTIVFMTRTVVEGRTVRRVKAVYEILPEPRQGHPRILVRAPGVQDEIEYTQVFRWDPRRDTFEPSSPEEVARRSVRLQVKAEALGWDRGRLVEELAARAELLERLTEKRIYNWKEFYRHLKAFHMQRRRTAA